MRTGDVDFVSYDLDVTPGGEPCVLVRLHVGLVPAGIVGGGVVVIT